jgi:uncharacterized membrane protein YdbT with pleckstrin-like domain
MNYTKKTLGANEEIVSIHKPSKWSLVGPVAVGVLGAPFTYGISLAIPLWAGIRYLTTEFTITNKKVLMKKGWIVRKTDELYLNKIEGVDVDQGIQGRILGYGDLIFSGSGTQSVKFDMVPKPLQKKLELQELVA